MPVDGVPELRSCGFLIFAQQPTLCFLLMEHADRLDLPKGHLDPGETDMECALRELNEETGILPGQIEIDPSFRFETHYAVRSRRVDGGVANKTLVIFLACLRDARDVAVTEHRGFRWQPWAPPHRIQTNTIDPLLAQVERQFGERGPFDEDLHATG